MLLEVKELHGRIREVDDKRSLERKSEVRGRRQPKQFVHVPKNGRGE